MLTVRSPFDDGLHGEAGPIRIAGVHQAVLRATKSFGLSLTPFESSQGSAVVAIQGKATTAADADGFDPGTLLDRYVGVLPAVELLK